MTPDGWEQWSTGLDAGHDAVTPLVRPTQAPGAVPPVYRSGGLVQTIVQALTFVGAGPMDVVCEMPSIGDPSSWGGPIAVPGVLVTVTVQPLTAAFASLSVLRTMNQLGVAGTQALTAALASTGVVLPIAATCPSQIVARVVSGGAGTMRCAISCLPVIDAQVPITAEGVDASGRDSADGRDSGAAGGGRSGGGRRGGGRRG